MVSGQSSRRAALAEINVTPLVDVMLVLLIIFMITAPMLQHEVEVNLPEVTNKPRTQSEDQLVLTITKEGSVFLNRKAYTLEALRPHLQVLSQAQPDQEMFLRADAEVPYGRVVQVMDAVKKAGILRLGMITQPEPDTR
jgi:biopolymer transport protein TolR